ncbi:hypothetical protein B0H17DRAFT_379771 [Mycena rosella]|uniref:Uncharacterized protein n=1 Tax=Mycena rosella TaxID=1033263 RepID=A0AAD7CR45_MYCRO|nr:hypothetical protein B0H17DRAFT_379771 [Mycena rosella]
MWRVLSLPPSFLCPLAPTPTESQRGLGVVCTHKAPRVSFIARRDAVVGPPLPHGICYKMPARMCWVTQPRSPSTRETLSRLGRRPPAHQVLALVACPGIACGGGGVRIRRIERLAVGVEVRALVSPTSRSPQSGGRFWTRFGS